MKVEIWSDVVCPWCYIGKRRFEQALSGFAHASEVQVTWRSFELDPGAPRQYPETLNALLVKKKGLSLAQATAMTAQLTALAADEGLIFHMERAQSGNTFDAHRLIHLAATVGRQDEVKEALLRAYFTEGRVIGDAASLVDIVSTAGLPEDSAHAVLAGDAYAAEVRADEQRAAAFGITGVPFVVIDERYGISGAQPSTVFRETLETAWAAARPLTMVGATASAPACDDEGCAV